MVAVLNENDDILLLLDIGVCARFHDDGSCLFWWENETGPERTLEFRAIRIAELTPIPHPATAAREMRVQRDRVCGLPAYEGFSYPVFQAPGNHQVTSPDLFTKFHESIALSDYQPGANGFDRMYRAVFVFDWLKRSVEVTPQDWFNQGNYDFGYQWISRMCRLNNGRLAGDGVRLGTFELDATGRQIARWLSQSEGYTLQ